MLSIQYVLRRTALAGTLVIIGLALKAVAGTLRGAHFEGYILLAALMLLIQAGLTVRYLPEWKSAPAK